MTGSNKSGRTGTIRSERAGDRRRVLASRISNLFLCARSPLQARCVEPSAQDAVLYRQIPLRADFTAQPTTPRADQALAAFLVIDRLCARFEEIRERDDARNMV